jgi:spore coat protein A
VLLVAFGVAGAGASARAETVTLQPSMDTTLYQDTPSASNGAGDYLFTGSNDHGAARRALIAFDVGAAVPPGSTIQTVELRLTLTRGQPADNTIELHQVTASWGEAGSNASGNEGGGAPAATGDATWSHRLWPDVPWTNPGGDYDAPPSATTVVRGTSGPVTWSAAPLAQDVQAWLDDPAHNFGWILFGDAPGAATSKRFGSRQGPADARPQLSIVFVPPATAIGACCAADGSCGFVLDPGQTCVGQYQGPGSACVPNACPPPVAACCVQDASAACSMQTQADCDAQKGGWQEGQATCDPNPCTAVLTPFVDPLPLPAPATPVAQSEDGPLTYRLAMVERRQKLHRDLPPTRVWGFDDGTLGGGTPGPTIEARSGVPIRVTWANDLRDDSGRLRTTHALPVDTCIDGAETNAPRTVIHLHGGHVPEEADGSPDATLLPGQEVTYDYPNNQSAATLWYHDHAMGITRLNVMMGLAGFYMLRDDAEDALGLPLGKYEVPLAIQDRSFHADGTFVYPEMWMEHFFGDTVMVNGKVWPYLDVDRGLYRFRILNGSNARTYTLLLSPFVWFVQIGSEGGLLSSGVAKPSVTIAPGERADVIVDFSSLAAGQEVLMMNTAPAPYPNGDDANQVTNVMKFRVTGQAGLPTRSLVGLRDIEPPNPAAAAVTRDFVLDRADDTCGGSRWRINALDYEDVTEMPRLGTSEIWRFINRSGESHPMHLHLVQFRVLDRQPFSVDSDDRVVLTGSPTSPPLEEAGWKDTVLAPPFQVTRILARFEDYVGYFPYHCHMLEHEDHAMMRQFQTLPACGDGGCPVEDGGVTAGPSGATGGHSGCECGVAGSGQGRDITMLVAWALLSWLLSAARRRRPRQLAALSVALALLVIVAVAACSSDTSRPARDAGRPDVPAGLPFGAACAADGACASGWCAAFGDGSQHCTVSCAQDQVCPEGSQGRKCNGKGFCAY